MSRIQFRFIRLSSTFRLSKTVHRKKKGCKKPSAVLTLHPFIVLSGANIICIRLSAENFLKATFYLVVSWKISTGATQNISFSSPPETTFTRLLHLVRGGRKTVDKILNSLSVRSGNIRKSRMGEWLIYIISYFRAPLSDPFLRNSRLSIENISLGVFGSANISRRACLGDLYTVCNWLVKL